MKIFRFIFVVVMFSSLNNSTVSAQPVRENDIILDMYYGYGSLSRAYVRGLAETNNGNFSGFGAIGLRFEYMLSDNLGLGFDANFMSSVASWTDEAFQNGQRLHIGTNILCKELDFYQD